MFILQRFMNDIVLLKSARYEKVSLSDNDNRSDCYCLFQSEDLRSKFCRDHLSGLLR